MFVDAADAIYADSAYYDARHMPRLIITLLRHAAMPRHAMVTPLLLLCHCLCHAYADTL